MTIFWLELITSINPKSSKPVSHQRQFFTYFLNSNLSIYTTIYDKVTFCTKYWEKLAILLKIELIM